MSLCDVILWCAGAILALYLLLELNYFLRTVLCVLCASFCKKRAYILDETRIAGICLTTDIDNLLSHMNNARFIRETDFAKLDFYISTGMLHSVLSKSGSIFMGASTIRYRRFIKLFSRYYVTTRLIYWDGQFIYLEHRFITPGDNFVNAIMMCRIRLVNCKADEVIAELHARSSKHSDVENGKLQRPELSPQLVKWIESNDISSASLRNGDNTEANRI